MRRWYLIHTKPSSEALALKHLLRQQYDARLPQALQTVRRFGRRRERIVALFPRYLFLHLNEGQQALAPVKFTTGVADIVRFGACYAIVPDQVMRDLEARADPATGLHRLNAGGALTRGTPVRIALGPLDGLEGIFEREAGADRVVILLKLLGRNAPVYVPTDSIVLSRAT